MQTDKLLYWIRQNGFILLCVAGIALWWIVCSLIHPVVPIMIDEANLVYLPVLGGISTFFLLLPVIAYVCTKEFRRQRWYVQLQSVGIALMLAFIVFRPYAYLHAQILFFSFVFICFVADKNRKMMRPPVFYLACCLYVVGMAFSMLWTQNSGEVSKYFNRLVPLVSYSVAFMFVRLTESDYRQLVLLFWRVVWIACLLTIACGIYEARRIGIDFSEFIHFRKTFILNVPVFDFLYAWSGTGHPSYNALWCIAGLACSFFLADRHHITFEGVVCTCLLTLFVVIITQSRIGTVMWGLIVVSGVLYLLRRHRKALWLTIVAGGTLCLITLITQWDAILSVYSDQSRLQLIQIARDYLRVDPWKGCGLGGMTYDYLQSVIGYEFRSWWPQYTETTMYPHNQFLGDWMQAGIIGLFVSLMWVVCGFITAFRQRSYIGVAYMTAVLFFMLIEMPFHFLGGSTIIAFFLCFIYSRRQREDCDIVSDMPPCG